MSAVNFRHSWWFGRLAAGALLVLFALPVNAKPSANSFAATLGAQERSKFEAWFSAQVFHAAAMDAYWAKVENRRTIRRAKRRKKRSFEHRDYVTDFPPVYDGPRISTSLLQRWRRYRDKDKPKSPTKTSTLPGLDVYYASARRHFDFVPERIPEIEFKRRYAREALSLGLTKEQVVKVYALETGGRGTADMQAGISPITGKGQPISSALGYAQLLAANSVSVLSKHGRKFVARLTNMVRQEQNPQRRAKLQTKLSVLRRMVQTARSIPYNWSRHRAFARTDKGRALHVLNIDGLIGPWMQVVKLAGLKQMAARKGRPQLTGAEIELMNLAGPATGLEMMLVTGIDKPTTNFFSRRAYYRNTVVRDKDSKGLLVALEKRMRAGLQQEGAKEFIAVFDELLGVRRSTAPASRATQSFRFAPGVFKSKN